MAEPGGLAVRLEDREAIPLAAELTVAPGELVALVGPSGSGKTTILRSIAGLHRPHAGLVACNGTVWFDTVRGFFLPPQARRVGLVFQDYALFPHLTALENVALALQPQSAEQRQARAAELLALVNLGGLEAREPARLSGGQRQRVALARALAREPQVLLLDEPFAAVDQVTRRKLQRELVALRRRVRVPILLVTHDLAEAAALADRMVVLHRGQTLQEGPPAELTARPASPLVARLLDQTNVFSGRLLERRAEGGGLLAWGSLQLEVRETGAFQAGEAVAWMVPPSHVLLHRRGRPSLGERENPVPGRIVEYLLLGETASVAMAVAGGSDVLSFTLPAHAARRNELEQDAEITVSLLADGLHLMPPEG